LWPKSRGPCTAGQRYSLDGQLLVLHDRGWALYVQVGSAAPDERLLGSLACNRCLWSIQPSWRSAALGPAIPGRRTSVRYGAARPHLFATRSQAHTSDAGESPDCRTVGTNRQHGQNCGAP
jgi:hypothetical protein